MTFASELVRSAAHKVEVSPPLAFPTQIRASCATRVEAFWAELNLQLAPVTARRRVHVRRWFRVRINLVLGVDALFVSLLR